MPLSYCDDIDDQESENEVIRILQRRITNFSAEPVPILFNPYTSRSISDDELLIIQQYSPSETFTRESAIDVLQIGNSKKRNTPKRAKRKISIPTQTDGEQSETKPQPPFQEEEEEEFPQQRMQ